MKSVSSALLTLSRIAAMSLVLLLFSGCPSWNDAPDASLKGKLVIKGSTTFGDELAPRLIAEYRKHRPGVTIEHQSTGSESGFTALLAGECDIASSSRPASKLELDAALQKGIELEGALVGYYGVAIIVNSNNPVSKLTQEQVRDIFTGAIPNWRMVGGLDAPIKLCIRDEDSATRRGFQGLAMGNREYAQGARTFSNYRELVAAVAEDSQSIGYCSMSLAERSHLKDVLVDGMPPTITSVNEDRYPYARGLHLYTNKGNDAPVVQDFVRFVHSSSGQRVVAELEFVRRFEPRFDAYVRD